MEKLTPDQESKMRQEMLDEYNRHDEANSRCSASAGSVDSIPDVLFDGYAVYSELTDHAKKYTSPENVSATLDAVVRLLKQNDQDHGTA